MSGGNCLSAEISRIGSRCSLVPSSTSQPLEHALDSASIHGSLEKDHDDPCTACNVLVPNLHQDPAKNLDGGMPGKVERSDQRHRQVETPIATTKQHERRNYRFTALQ